jgi:hypothetical protein
MNKYPFRLKTYIWLTILSVLSLGAFGFQTVRPGDAPLQSNGTVFAVIGDFGLAGQNEADVANLVKSWNPDFIVTVGDNNYPHGSASSIDENIGQYYHEYIFPYHGKYGSGSTYKRLFPTLGNHDWEATDAKAYYSYFSFYNETGYYDFIKGTVHFFVLDSDPSEPDGTSSTSKQAKWLQSGLAQSSSQFNLVLFHHPAYSSGKHGSTAYMQWPFKAWGADAVLNGHDHTYERILVDGLPYFVDGLGGAEIYPFVKIVPGSQIRFNQDYGAMRVEAQSDSLKFQFFTRAGLLIDEYTISKGVPKVASITRVNSNPTNAAIVNYLVTFTESVLGVDTSDFSLNTTNLSGASINSVSGSGSAYTVSVNSGSADGTIRLDLIDDGTIINTKGNKLGGTGTGSGNFTTGEIYNIDKTPPNVISITRLDPNPTNSPTVDFQVNFSEPVTGIDASDFSLNTTDGATINTITGSGAAYVVSVNTGQGNDQLRLDIIDDDSIIDGAGNSLGGAGLGNGNYQTGETYSINKAAPMVTSIVRADPNPTNASLVNFLITFTTPVTGVDASDFQLNLTGITGASIASVNGSGLNYTVAVNSAGGDGSIGLTLIDDDSIINASGTPLGYQGFHNGDFSNGEIYTIDNTPPAVTSIIRASPDPSRAGSVDFIVTFSEKVSGVDSSDFILNSTNISGASITSIKDANPFFDVTVNTGSGTGSLRLDMIDDGSIRDSAGNTPGGSGAGNGNYESGETYTIEKSFPRVTSITRASPNPAATASVDFIVTFSEPVTGVDVSDFNLTTTNLIGSSILSVSNVNPFYLVTVNPGAGTGTLRLDLVDNDSIANSSGDPLAGPGAANGNYLTGETYIIAKNPVNFPAPSIRNPKQYVLTNDPQPLFSWDIVRGAIAYEITIALDNNFTQIVNTQVVNGQTFLSPALPDNIYFWHVRAYNSSFQPGKLSVNSVFAVDTTAPPPPRLISPADRATTSRTNFIWEKISSATKYQIEIDNNSDFSSPELSTMRNDPSYQPSKMQRGTYLWHVRAKDMAGNWSPWSIPFTLTLP